MTRLTIAAGLAGALLAATPALAGPPADLKAEIYFVPPPSGGRAGFRVYVFNADTAFYHSSGPVLVTILIPARFSVRNEAAITQNEASVPGGWGCSLTRQNFQTVNGKSTNDTLIQCVTRGNLAVGGRYKEIVVFSESATAGPYRACAKVRLLPGQGMNHFQFDKRPANDEACLQATAQAF